MSQSLVHVNIIKTDEHKLCLGNELLLFILSLTKEVMLRFYMYAGDKTETPKNVCNYIHRSNKSNIIKLMSIKVNIAAYMGAVYSEYDCW